MNKLKDKKSVTAPRIWVTPTPERFKQNGGLVGETIAINPRNGTLIQRYRATWASPLEAYRAHKIIDEGSYRAGLRFHEAFYGAAICRKIDIRPVSIEEASAKPTRHEQLLKQAYTMLPSDTLNVVVDVCGLAKPTYSPRALEKLRKGLGHLAVQWHTNAIEVCEHKKK